MTVECFKVERVVFIFRYLAENVSGNIERPGSKMENLPGWRKTVRYIEEKERWVIKTRIYKILYS